MIHLTGPWLEIEIMTRALRELFTVLYEHDHQTNTAGEYLPHTMVRRVLVIRPEDN